MGFGVVEGQTGGATSCREDGPTHGGSGNPLPAARLTGGITEATIQAELYHHMRLRGIEVSLELRIPGARADMAILNRGRLAGLIEVKRGPGSTKRSRSRQTRAYEASGIPWRYCVGLGQIPGCVIWAHSLVSPLNSPSLV